MGCASAALYVFSLQEKALLASREPVCSLQVGRASRPTVVRPGRTMPAAVLETWGWHKERTELRHRSQTAAWSCDDSPRPLYSPRSAFRAYAPRPWLPGGIGVSRREVREMRTVRRPPSSRCSRSLRGLPVEWQTIPQLPAATPTSTSPTINEHDSPPAPGPASPCRPAAGHLHMPPQPLSLIGRPWTSAQPERRRFSCDDDLPRGVTRPPIVRPRSGGTTASLAAGWCGHGVSAWRPPTTWDGDEDEP